MSAIKLSPFIPFFRNQAIPRPWMTPAISVIKVISASIVKPKRAVGVGVVEVCLYAVEALVFAQLETSRQYLPEGQPRRPRVIGPLADIDVPLVRVARNGAARMADEYSEASER